MSFKYRVVEESSGHFVLPRSGEMRTDVHAFLSRGLFDRTDEKLWSQAAAAAAYPGAIGFYLMPDTHVGYGIPVGGVLVTDETIIQAGSGYDISCGVVYMKVPGLHAEGVVDPALRLRWIREVERRVATGLGSHRPDKAPRVTQALVEDVLLHGAKALAVSADLCERQYIPVDDAFEPKAVTRAYDKAAGQLGSVGGGNHFIEMQIDQAAVRSGLRGRQPPHDRSRHSRGYAGRLRRRRRGVLRDQPQPRTTGDASVAGWLDNARVRAPQGITGVVGNTERTPLDECAHVYKSLHEVLAVLEGEGIARVAHRLYPVANIKGTD